MGFFRKTARSLVKRALSQPEKPTEPTSTSQPKEEKEKDDYAGDQFAQMECGAQELKERLEAGEDVMVVDVRENREIKSGMLPSAVHIPMRELPARWKEVAEANEIVCYCVSGTRSYDMTLFLRSKGLFNATSLEGGISAWRAIGGETPIPE
jgi:rhodanese-related sulfurtransferase